MANAHVAQRRGRERLKLVAETFYGTAWHMRLAKLQEIQEFLQAKLADQIDPEKVKAQYEGASSEKAKRYEIIDGVAVIPITGTLTRRANLMSYYSGGTSYEVLGHCIREVLADDRVKKVLLRCHSPGGASGGGLAECSDLIVAGRAVKEIWSIADSVAYSACYYLGSAAERIILSSDSELGAIGTYWVHVDYSRQREMLGEKVTFIQAGKYKTAGHPDKPLDKSDKTVIQSYIDYYNSLFLNAVANNRGLSLADTESWAEGREFVGQQALDAGLADSLGTYTDTLAELRERAKKNPVSVIVPEPEPVEDELETPEEESHMANAATASGGQSPATPTAPATAPAAAAAAPVPQTQPTASPVTLSQEQFEKLMGAIRMPTLTGHCGVAEPAKTEAPAAAAAAAAGSVESERIRCAEIQALGDRYGDTKLAAKLIGDGVSIEGAKAAYFDKLASTQKPVEHSEAPEGEAAEAKLRKEYRDNAETFQQLGLAEDQYVLAQLGKATPTPKK